VKGERYPHPPMLKHQVPRQQEKGRKVGGKRSRVRSKKEQGKGNTSSISAAKKIALNVGIQPSGEINKKEWDGPIAGGKRRLLDRKGGREESSSPVTWPASGEICGTRRGGNSESLQT